MSNHKRNVFYTGVTSNLSRRVKEHKSGETKFTSKYRCYYLMYYEEYNDVRNAIAREKQLKKWRHQWKVELIQRDNPEMDDLAKNW